MTRRGAIAAAMAAAALATGCSKRAIHPDGSRVAHFTVHSRLVHHSMGETVVVPPGRSARPRPLLVFLHGRGGNEDSNLDDQMFAALRALGRRAPVVLFPSGSEHSYWHDRADGAWGRYVTSEAIPQAERRFGTDPRRVAISGMSMGGFGAYDIALRHPGRFCAVGGHSPALWRTAGETAPGAFDDARDFDRHDIVGTARTQPRRFAGQPLWVDAGLSDPFDPGDRAFVAALRAGGVPIEVHRSPGGHDRSYWHRHWKDYLPFYARALAACRR